MADDVATPRRSARDKLADMGVLPPLGDFFRSLPVLSGETMDDDDPVLVEDESATIAETSTIR